MTPPHIRTVMEFLGRDTEVLVSIPDDVLDAAGKAWIEALSDRSTDATSIAAIARAIMAERERCAKIAEGRAGGTDYDLEPEAAVAESVTARAIAAAIHTMEPDAQAPMTSFHESIPEDVMKAAMAAGNGWLFTEPKAREELNDVIARAIMAERERHVPIENALRRSIVAIDDWLNLHASDHCDDAVVRDTEARVMSVGTIAYIADVQEQNRAAIRKGEA